MVQYSIQPQNKRCCLFKLTLSWPQIVLNNNPFVILINAQAYIEIMPSSEWIKKGIQNTESLQIDICF